MLRKMNSGPQSFGASVDPTDRAGAPGPLWSTPRGEEPVLILGIKLCERYVAHQLVQAHTDRSLRYPWFRLRVSHCLD
jgi:hypothetical protein